MKNNRREFLKFLGASSVGVSSLSLIQACQSSLDKSASPFPTQKDDVVLLNGLSYYPIISWGDKMKDGLVFGFNNDYIDTEYLSDDELIMWVNHEYTNPLFVSGMERNKENIDKERSQTGGSLIKLKKVNGSWKFIKDDEHNRGVRADTPMTYAYDRKIQGSNQVIGTCSNCAGGKTPWNTFLTCEENYDMNYGELDRKTGKLLYEPYMGWNKVYPHSPEHYGWVVEVEPKTGKAQKHIKLGRFAHESATCHMSKTNKVVVYSGDDKKDEHLYKFVSKSGSDFKEGVLYAANIEKGQWLPLDLELSPQLKKHFKSQIEVLTYPREAAKILGATELNRPEDIEIHPKTGEVFVSLTNNKPKGDLHGSILKISEANDDHTSTQFSAKTFAMGGEYFSCPDNLTFDSEGNLWMATDISGSSLNKGEYQQFKNNGLFVIPTNGKHAGKVIQVASAPIDAEFTGLKFDKDETTLFLSVQHPGETTKDIKAPTSTWPTGSMPKPTVIAITGDTLGKIKSLS